MFSILKNYNNLTFRERLFFHFRQKEHELEDEQANLDAELRWLLGKPGQSDY